MRGWMVEFTDLALESVMDETKRPWEDHLLERKTDRELKDLRRTATGFANSVKPGHTAVILVGEGNDGSITGISNADEQQKKIRSELEKIYPPIVWRQRLYEQAGKTCIRIEIDYSGETPHFGDAAWIRRGSETIKAPDEILQKLIDYRNSKVRELSLWLGKAVTVSWSIAGNISLGPNWNQLPCTVFNVTGFYATFELAANSRRSEPLAWLELSWDDNHKRPRVFVNPQMSRMV